MYLCVCKLSLQLLRAGKVTWFKRLHCRCAVCRLPLWKWAEYFLSLPICLNPFDSDGPPRGSPPVRERKRFKLLDAPLPLFVVAVRGLNYRCSAIQILFSSSRRLEPTHHLPSRFSSLVNLWWWWWNCESRCARAPVSTHGSRADWQLATDPVIRRSIKLFFQDM